MNATAKQLPEMWAMLDAWNEYRRVVPLKFPNMDAALSAAEAAEAPPSSEKSPKVRGYDEFWNTLSGGVSSEHRVYVAWQTYVSLLKDTLYEVGVQGRDVRDGLDYDIAIAVAVISVFSVLAAVAAGGGVYVYATGPSKTLHIPALAGGATAACLVAVLVADMTRESKKFTRRMWHRMLPALGVDSDESQTTQVCTCVVSTLDVLDSKMTTDAAAAQAGKASNTYDDYLRKELPTLPLKLNVLSPETIRSTMTLADSVRNNSTSDTTMFDQLQTVMFLLRRSIDPEAFWVQRKFMVDGRAESRPTLASVIGTLRDALHWAVASGGPEFTATINGNVRILDVRDVQTAAAASSQESDDRKALASEVAARLDRERDTSAMWACIKLMAVPDDVLRDALTTSVDDIVTSGLQAYADDVLRADDGAVTRKARAFVVSLMQSVLRCFTPSTERTLTATQFACVWSNLRVGSLLQVRNVLRSVNDNLGKNNVSLAPSNQHRYSAAKFWVQVAIIKAVLAAAVVVSLAASSLGAQLQLAIESKMNTVLRQVFSFQTYTAIVPWLAIATFVMFLVGARVAFSKYRADFNKEERVRNTKDTIRGAVVLERTMDVLVADVCKAKTSDTCHVSTTAMLGHAVIPHVTVLQRDISEFLEVAGNCNLIKSRMRLSPEHPVMDYVVFGVIVAACSVAIYVLVTNQDAGLLRTLRNIRDRGAPSVGTSDSQVVVSAVSVIAIVAFVSLFTYTVTSKETYQAMLKTIYSGSRSCAS